MVIGLLKSWILRPDCVSLAGQGVGGWKGEVCHGAGIRDGSDGDQTGAGECQRKRKNAAESFAARFAAKEAGAKALGTGISRGVSWKEFEVRREASGRPTLHLSGRAAELAEAMGVRRIQLSLTHSRELALAVVVAED